MVLKVLSLAAPPEVLQLQVGDTCRVMVYFDYAGPGYTGARLYAAIGIRGATFAEKVAGYVTLSPIPSSPVKTTYSANVDIPITTAIQLGTGYDMYVKMTNLPGPDLYNYVNDVISIVEEAPPATLGIRLKNPPPDSEMWKINIHSHDQKATKASPSMGIDGMVTWNTLSLYWFPIYVTAVVAKLDRTILWQVMSIPGFEWFDYYNPDAVIPGFGDYYLNCDTGLFEKV